jgi:hypothetical protein
VEVVEVDLKDCAGKDKKDQNVLKLNVKNQEIKYTSKSIDKSSTTKKVRKRIPILCIAGFHSIFYILKIH